MDPAAFRSPAAGRVVRVRDYYAFVPADLPPVLAYDAPLVLALSRADAAVGELAGLGRHLPNPRILMTPYVLREAILSTRIEGTRAEVSEVLEEDVSGRPSRADVDDVQEVRNYVDALEYGIKRLSTLPLSLRLVRELHERLMTGVRGGESYLGEFRRSQNWIGPAGSNPNTAPYVPPPPEYLMETLGSWELFLHRRGHLPDLIRCALIHEQFEAIHPFLDGNGRLGRLLIPLFLMERGRLSQPLLYTSAYIEEHRQDYYDLLQRVRTDGDWTWWVHFFLAGVEHTAGAALGQARRLIDLREEYRGRLRDKPRAAALLDHVFANPFVTAKRVEELLSVSAPSARQAIGVLEERGILGEVSGRSWRRLYLARSILRAIEDKADEGDGRGERAG